MITDLVAIGNRLKQSPRQNLARRTQSSALGTHVPPAIKSFACAMLFLFASCQRPAVKQAQISMQELTAAVGISPFCADAHFTSACYARLVATTTDGTGIHRKEISTPSADKEFRLCVLLVSDPRSGSFQRITYSISAVNGGGGGQGYIHLKPETTFDRMTTNASNTFRYDLALRTHSETSTIHIELETSSTPSPKDSPSP